MQHLLEQALASNNAKAISLALKLVQHPLTRFKPRPDQSHLLDQQSSFYEDSGHGIAVGLGGNGSGKSYCSSARVARFLFTTPPPEPLTPFWVLSQNMELATGTCWLQNLSKFILPEFIHDTVWFSAAKGLPRTVILKPHANGNSWVIEFKSYDQGRAALQGSNVAGWWCDEQADFTIITELLARTRKWSLPANKTYSLTPIDPDLKLEEIAANPDQWPDWTFYRFNTRCNDQINPDFVRQIEANEISELVETRLTGAFATYEGQIYKQFDSKLHVVEPFDIPRTWLHVRGLDLGWSHATACVWGAKDHEGNLFIYREYLKSHTSVEDHVKEINGDWSTFINRGSTYADPAAAQTLHEFALRGLPTASANKEVLAGIATVQSLLRAGADGKPKLFIFKSCPLLISQIRTYIWDKSKADKPLKVNDDLVDALRYLCHSHRMEGDRIKYEPLKLPERQRKLGF